MNKKKVLLDLRNLKNPTYGFGQIALNYAKHFSEIELPDIQFVFLVPDNCNMDFGENVEVVRFDKRMKHNKNLLPKVDLWHSVNQFQTLQRIDSTTKFVFTIHDLNFLREKNWLRQLKHKFRLNRRIKKANAVTAISMFVRNIPLLFRDFRLPSTRQENTDYLVKTFSEQVSILISTFVSVQVLSFVVKRQLL